MLAGVEEGAAYLVVRRSSATRSRCWGSVRGRRKASCGGAAVSPRRKTTAEVHDYHDADTGVLASSLAKRAPGYISLGFPGPRRSASRR
ncbi:MAG: hypothetical protein GEV28_02380 [Actinophytocola sp.]|nr:hypothetical protein [Actinophytocola sp.]